MRVKDMKKVLVGCEYSGTVRDAFSLKGWDAWSCDLLPTESELTKQEGKHYQCDIFDVLYQDWDLLIAFPPCTYLSFVFTKNRYSLERLQKKIEAYQFFLDLWSAPIEHICLENPIGFAHTGLLPYSQIIESYYFGDHYKKKTCLWLKNLPKLKYSKENNLFYEKTAVEPTHLLVSGRRKSKEKFPALNKPFSSGKQKSKFHKGIANAMAEQWTEYFDNKLKLQ